jgi:uncharacterized SAM-binding protein YcdF (DUF218 family)
LRFVVLWSSGLLVLLSAIYYLQSPILIGLANAWIVNDPVTHADAIVVLGGGLESRPFEAARLFHRGFAPKILFMDVKLSPTAEMNITLPEKELARRVLLSNNVPESAILAIGKSVSSTYEEVQAVRSWIQDSGSKSVIIPTDLFHTRRVRWLFHKKLKDITDEVRVTAVPSREYAATNWWRHEEGLIAFQNEVIKYLYYLVKY